MRIGPEFRDFVTSTTYSRLHTERLISDGKEAESKDLIEAQMIVNHRDAISFLVNSAVDD